MEVNVISAYEVAIDLVECALIPSANRYTRYLYASMMHSLIHLERDSLDALSPWHLRKKINRETKLLVDPVCLR